MVTSRTHSPFGIPRKRKTRDIMWHYIPIKRLIPCLKPREKQPTKRFETPIMNQCKKLLQRNFRQYSFIHSNISICFLKIYGESNYLKFHSPLIGSMKSIGGIEQLGEFSNSNAHNFCKKSYQTIRNCLCCFYSFK